MRPKVPRGTKASKALPIANSKVSGDKSFADVLGEIVFYGEASLLQEIIIGKQLLCF